MGDNHKKPEMPIQYSKCYAGVPYEHRVEPYNPAEGGSGLKWKDHNWAEFLKDEGNLVKAEKSRWGILAQ